MPEVFSVIFLGTAALVVVAAIVYILGFALSGIAGLFVSAEERIRHHGGAHPVA